ncbi:hypothetical protein [Streptomyces sp. NPDC059009]|uniref:hypothetical protein n=1 Tax=Streptomyces sp. NPDC059009 TaxID=3346694 RepID=UPI00369C85F0
MTITGLSAARSAGMLLGAFALTFAIAADVADWRYGGTRLPRPPTANHRPPTTDRPSPDDDPAVDVQPIGCLS